MSNGVPGAGAGNLETKASVDVYRFSVPEGGQSVDADWLSGPGGSAGVDWRVLVAEASGAVISSNTLNNDRQPSLAAGIYRLEIRPYQGETGAYSLKVWPV